MGNMKHLHVHHCVKLGRTLRLNGARRGAGRRRGARGRGRAGDVERLDPAAVPGGPREDMRRGWRAKVLRRQAALRARVRGGLLLHNHVVAPCACYRLTAHTAQHLHAVHPTSHVYQPTQVISWVGSSPAPTARSFKAWSKWAGFAMFGLCAGQLIRMVLSSTIWMS